MKRKTVKKCSTANMRTSRDTITIPAKPGDNVTALVAASHLRPSVQAGATVRAYSKDKDGSGPDTIALITELGAQIEAIAKGDMRRPEAMLVAHAHALDTIFSWCARRAVGNFGEYLSAGETYLRLALKAQAQTARTLEVLGNLRNPSPVAFVRQANIGTAVQVNNGAQPRAQDKIPHGANELLRAKDGESLERLPATTASKVDPSLETLEAVNRAQDSAG